MSDEVASGIIQADRLQKFVDVLGALVDECKIHFHDGGIEAMAVDPANVAMYRNVSLSRSAFESYDAPGQVRIGVDLTKLDDYLTSAKGEDLVEFGVDMESRHLNLRYRTVEHSMALIDPDAIRNDPDTPDLELPNYVEIQSEHLKEARKNIAFVTDHFWIKGDVVAGEGELILFGRGDTDRTELTYTEADLEREEIGEEAELCFSLPYIEDVVKPIPNQTTVGVAFGDEFPMIWDWDAFEETLSVEFMLAPRINSQ
jgi:proliferating cell nuclear antigen